MRDVLFFSLVSLFFLFACEKEDDDHFVVDFDIVLTIATNEGTDLLDPASTNAIKKDDIRIYYEIVGKRETYQSTAGDGVVLDNPSGFTLNPSDGSPAFNQKYFLTIISNPTVGKATTIIALAGKGEVKLIADVSKGNGYHRIDRISYNDNLVWPVPGNEGPKYVMAILD